MSYRHPCNLCGQPPVSPPKPMKKQHQKRMERAEKCCAALRQYVAMNATDPNGARVFRKALDLLLSWMRVAPKKVRYREFTANRSDD